MNAHIFLKKCLIENYATIIPKAVSKKIYKLFKKPCNISKVIQHSKSIKKMDKKKIHNTLYNVQLHLHHACEQPVICVSNHFPLPCTSLHSGKAMVPIPVTPHGDSKGFCLLCSPTG